MNLLIKSVITCLLIALSSLTQAASIDICVKVGKSVSSSIHRNSDFMNIISIVAEQVASNKSCACEIVKAAIITSKAKIKLVKAIVQIAMVEAPEQARIIGLCAYAVCPNVPKAGSVIQELLKEYDLSYEGGDSDKGGLPDGGKVGLPDECPPGDPRSIHCPPLFPEFPPMFPPVVTVPPLTNTGSSSKVLNP
jgi:hypothetical protein